MPLDSSGAPWGGLSRQCWLSTTCYRPGYEQVTAFTEAETGLKAIVAIHDTTLGPACGGTRIWPYAREEEALQDVLLLARAMTYKAAVAGLDIGGGKAVIITDPRTGLAETLRRAFGRCLNILEGRFLTTADVGGTGRDMEVVSRETDHVVGLPVSRGGSGDSSIMSGLGLYVGMKACTRAVWGSDSLEGRRVAVHGFGKVATQLAPHLLAEGARMVATALHDSTLRKARSMGVEVVAPDEIYDVDCDIFSPCALGGVINGDTIPRLSCRIVAGAANNQLATTADGEELHRMGISSTPPTSSSTQGASSTSQPRWAPPTTRRWPGRRRRVSTGWWSGLSKHRDARTCPPHGRPTGWPRNAWPRPDRSDTRILGLRSASNERFGQSFRSW